MLTLPESIVIKRNKSVEGKLIEKARAWVTKDARSNGVHASELLDPRQAYWKRTNPKELSDRLVNTFLVGKVLHAFVVNAVDGVKTTSIDETDIGSQTSKELGIEYSPDFLINGKVRELKTSRSFYEPKTLKDVAMYAEQILVYMASTNTVSAQLWVLYLNLRDETNRTSPEWRAYDITVTQEDLASIKTDIKQIRAQLLVAVAEGSDKNLPPCRDWLKSPKFCDYWDRCSCAKEKEQENE
jgi:hypothetical protein